MKSNYVVDADKACEIIRQIAEGHPESVFITGVNVGGDISAPTKKKQYCSHKLTFAFSPDCFESEGIEGLLSGGGLYFAVVPKEHVRTEILPPESENAQ